MNNNLLQELNERLAAIALVPSSKATIKIKPISIKQIKNVVDESMDVTYFDIGFKRAITNILKANIISDIPIELTEADVNILFLYLKNGGTFKGVKINDIIAKTTKDVSSIEIQKTITLDSITINLTSPTTTRLKTLEDLLIKSIETDPEGNLKNEQETGTMYFLIEILKNISSLKINDIELVDGKTVPEQLEVVQELPYQIANEIVKYSQDLQLNLNKALQYNDDTEVTFDISFFE
jgi:hypothetical protein